MELKPGDIIEQGTILTKLISDPKKNRLRCFMCGRWVRQDLTVMKKFNGIDEPVCYSCADKLTMIDDMEEMERTVYEKKQEVQKG